ncbi:MAG: class I SAM-dependent methyltransferase [Phycisphaerae bacterium]
MRRDLHEQNRLSWNAATAAHNSHKADQAGFFRRGGDTLFPEEVELLGDLRGMRVLHLQCNAGQDTLSLVQRGAVATGVDISDEAIDFAQRLSADSGVPATFERADVYDWLAAAGAIPEPRFDIVFSSYGALCWLSDPRSWARGVASVLRPGGRLVVVEFHPVLMMFESNLTLRYSYFAGPPIDWADGVRDYVAVSDVGLTDSGWVDGVQNFRNPHRCHEFQWTIADILTAVIDAGLRVDAFREYPYSNGCRFLDEQIRDEEQRWRLPPEMPQVPQMFALAARCA